MDSGDIISGSPEMREMEMPQEMGMPQWHKPKR
jgi:hypothetical protein